MVAYLSLRVGGRRNHSSVGVRPRQLPRLGHRPGQRRRVGRGNLHPARHPPRRPFHAPRQARLRPVRRDPPVRARMRLGPGRDRHARTVSDGRSRDDLHPDPREPRSRRPGPAPRGGSGGSRALGERAGSGASGTLERRPPELRRARSADRALRQRPRVRCVPRLARGDPRALHGRAAHGRLGPRPVRDPVERPVRARVRRPPVLARTELAVHERPHRVRLSRGGAHGRARAAPPRDRRPHRGGWLLRVLRPIRRHALWRRRLSPGPPRSGSPGPGGTDGRYRTEIGREVVRQHPGRQGCRPCRRQGRVHHLRGALGVREVDPAAHGRGTRGDQPRRGLGGRTQRHRRAALEARARHGLSVLCALSPHVGPRQHRLLAQDRRGAEGGARAQGRRGGAGPEARRAAGPPPAGALRRPAPAGRDRSMHRAGSDRVPLRRAAVQPRRGAPRRDALRDREAPPLARRDHDLRDARPGRGDDPRRPASWS